MSRKAPMPTVAWGIKETTITKLGKVQINKLRELYGRFYTKCAKCGSALDLEDYATIRYLKCTCRTVTCGGCGKRANSQSKCCADGLAFSMWMLLGLIDAEESQSRQSTEAKGNPLNLPVLYKNRDVTKGIGYANDYAYNASSLGSSSRSHSSQTPLPETEKQSDLEMTKTLRGIISLLPMRINVPDHPDPVFATLRSLFGRLFGISFLFDRIAALIRNDSIANMTERKELYHTIFEFIEKILWIPELSHLILEPRRRAEGLGVLAASPNFGSRGDQVVLNTELSPSLLKLCKNPYRQAKIFLAYSDKQALASSAGRPTRKRSRGCQGNKGKGKAANSEPTPDDSALDPEPATDDDSAKLCRLIVQICEQFEQTRIDDVAVEVDPMKAWAEYMEQNRVTYTDEVLKNHKHSKNFGSSSWGYLGRMGAITKEIGVLTTSLPPGIFVKVAESRSDVMKVLMVGVQGTPYDGGLFTFDMLLTPSYPKDPPKMLFTLEKVDEDGHPINPNLHAISGTVCLSLLNTWGGDETQRWQPNKSTLLAVLVSVHSFILGAPSPYENEPGQATLGNTPQALQYNNSVQNKVVGRAMIPWVEGKTQHNIWNDIVAKYWECNGQGVLARVNEATIANHLLAANAKRLGELLKTPASGGNKRKRDDGEDDTEEDPAAQRWAYMGEWTMKKIREACHELGAKPAKTMKESVERLETAVNDNDLGSTELGHKWGQRV